MNRISEDVGKVRMYVGPAFMYSINTMFIVYNCNFIYAKYSPRIDSLRIITLTNIIDNNI